MRPGSQGGAKLETRGAGPGAPPGPVPGNPPAGGSPGWRRQPHAPPCSGCRPPGWGSSLTSPLPGPAPSAAVSICRPSHGGCNPPPVLWCWPCANTLGSPGHGPVSEMSRLRAAGPLPSSRVPGPAPRPTPSQPPQPCRAWYPRLPVGVIPRPTLLLSDAPPFSRTLATASTLVGGCARLPGPLGDAGLDFPETRPLASLHPWTSWGPLLRLASPDPPHLPLPTGASGTSALSPSHPRHLCGARRSASPRQEHPR